MNPLHFFAPSAAQDVCTRLAVGGEWGRLEGTFDIADSIHIECEVRGRLNVGGQLFVGAHGVVHAAVHAAEALILGQFDGDLIVSGIVEMAATASVNANIQCDSIVIAKGARFSGSVTRLQASLQASIPARAVAGAR